MFIIIKQSLSKRLFRKKCVYHIVVSDEFFLINSFAENCLSDVFLFRNFSSLCCVFVFLWHCVNIYEDRMVNSVKHTYFNSLLGNKSLTWILNTRILMCFIKMLFCMGKYCAYKLLVIFGYIIEIIFLPVYCYISFGNAIIILGAGLLREFVMKWIFVGHEKCKERMKFFEAFFISKIWRLTKDFCDSAFFQSK